MRYLRKRGYSLLGAGLLIALVLLTGLSLTACQRTAMPKPVATPRLTYPHMEYVRFSAPDYPFQLDYPAFFQPTRKPSRNNTVLWLDFRWEHYGLTLYTTFQRFAEPEEAARQPVIMAALLDEKRPKGTTVIASTKPVTPQGWTIYLFEIDGSSPTPLEFLLTDGHRFCFSGRLLFDSLPDREAMADILDGLTKDMLHMMVSFTPTPTP